MSTLLAYFQKPFSVEQTAKDGAVLGFENISNLFHQNTSSIINTSGIAAAKLKSIWDLKEELDRRMPDIVYANCGTLSSWLFHLRHEYGYEFSIYYEIRTFAWVGYILVQEFAKLYFKQGDRAYFPSHYAAELWVPKLNPETQVRIKYPIINQNTCNIKSDVVALDKPSEALCLSGVSLAKGTNYIPEIIQKLNESGWKIKNVKIAGRIESKELFMRIDDLLIKQGIHLEYLGELQYKILGKYIKTAKVILFPSISSFESLGRVLIEAFMFNKTLISANFGASPYYLNSALIPVKYKQQLINNTHESLPLAELDMKNWIPPSPKAQTKYKTDLLLDTFLQSRFFNEPSISHESINPGFTWTLTESEMCHAKAKSISREIDKVLSKAEVENWFDLGGIVKQTLHQANYTPRIKIEPN